MHKTILTAALALALSPASAQPNQYATTSGAVCKPAGQSANNPGTYFAPKAIGGRNEGTSNIFVICPFSLTPTPAEGGVITEFTLSAYTLDGGAHSMTCTAVIGSLNRATQPVYSSKTITVVSSDPYSPTLVTWKPGDFSGASPSGGIIGSAWATVTCLLPGQTAIALMYAKLNPTIQ